MSELVELVSVVIRCFNEIAVLRQTHERLHSVAGGLTGCEVEFLYVDDGSTDGTAELLAELADGDRRVRVLTLSRNFGHQAALTAGLDHARGAAVVTIDADLQDPPEVIPEMVQRWRDGDEVVLGRRLSRRGETWLRLAVTGLFYRLLSGLSEQPVPRNVADFRLLDRRVVEELCQLRERDRYLRGLVAWLGFRVGEVTYVRDARAAGRSKYSVAKLVGLAASGFVSCCLARTMWLWLPMLPLALLSLGAGACLIFAPITRVSYALLASAFLAPVLGLALLLLAVSAVAGAASLMLLARLYDQARGRPLYVLRNPSPSRSDLRKSVHTELHDVRSPTDVPAPTFGDR